MTSRSYPARPFLVTSIAVFRGGRVMLAQRTAEPGQGLWSLPGGMVELGETCEAAALRELEEETGVRATIAGLVDIVEVIERDEKAQVKTHASIVVYAGHWTAGDGTAGPECGGVLWMLPEDVGALNTTRGLAAVVAKAARVAVCQVEPLA